MIRAETAANMLKTAKEQISDSLLVAMVLKGLPSEFKPFATVITQKDKPVSFSDFKTALRSYEETEKCCDDAATKNVMALASKPIICYSCGVPGHKSNECRKRSNSKNWRSGPGPNHRKWCGTCKSGSHDSRECRRNKKEAVKTLVHTSDTDDEDHSFQFHVGFDLNDSDHDPDSVKSLLVDCGATTHVITDKTKFVEFD